MTTNRLSITLVGFLSVAWSTTVPTARADDEAAALKAADQKFETLLTAAQKDPAKADWKALRHAFAKTSHYEPYSITWRNDITKVGKDIRAGNLKEADAALVKLLKREHFMRIDGLAMAVALYQKSGDTEKARKHRDFLEGLKSALLIPGHGTSFEKPIEVLFIEEEYLVLELLGLKWRQQALTDHGGHRFDVLTTHAKAGKPEQDLYFNIDMPWNALQASMEKVFSESKKSGAKK